uniref:polysaccharide biosynthesis C-terminal domain-containing protein n=1 Tax=Methanobrevibacter arboriphilus TaxID=39441 RepID=UPI001CDA65C3
MVILSLQGLYLLYLQQLLMEYFVQKEMLKKTTYAMSLGAILNIILDPLFIYTWGYGIAGAGIATVLSMAVSSFIILYWFKKDTYIRISLKFF